MMSEWSDSDLVSLGLTETELPTRCVTVYRKKVIETPGWELPPIIGSQVGVLHYTDLLIPPNEWRTYTPRLHPWSQEEIDEFRNVEQNTDEWLALRKKVIGSSTLASLIGLTTDYMLYIDSLLVFLGGFKDTYHDDEAVIKTQLKTEQKKGILLHDDSLSAHLFQHGHWYEDVGAILFEWIMDKKLEKCGIIVNNKYPFLGASCDRLVVPPSPDTPMKDRYVAEFKSPHYVNYEYPPEQYVNQLMMQCVLYGCRQGYLIALLVPQTLDQPIEFKVWEVRFNDKYWEKGVMPRLLEVMDVLQRKAIFGYKPLWLNQPLPEVEYHLIEHIIGLEPHFIVEAANIAKVPLPKGWFEKEQ